MITVSPTVVLRSKRDYDGRIPPAPVGHLLKSVPVVIRQCVSMRFQRRNKRGRPPKWLEAASDVRVIDLCTEEDTIVRFDAPLLGEAAVELYKQNKLDYGESEALLPRPAPKDTGFDLLADMLSDVMDGDEDSERFDQDLLKSLLGFKHVINGFYHKMLVSGRRYSVNAPAVMTNTTLMAAEILSSKTPSPITVRLVGVLDAVRISTQTFRLKLDDGQEVRGIFDKGDFDGVLELLRAKQRVLVRGEAFFKPSGQLLLVDAQEVASGEGETSLWSSKPQAETPRAVLPVHHKARGISWLKAIAGQWPGDETDEEIDEALRGLR